jgi:hypothetical protein
MRTDSRPPDLYVRRRWRFMVENELALTALHRDVALTADANRGVIDPAAIAARHTVDERDVWQAVDDLAARHYVRLRGDLTLFCRWDNDKIARRAHSIAKRLGGTLADYVPDDRGSLHDRTNRRTG